jgi:hypothetical protein
MGRILSAEGNVSITALTSSLGNVSSTVKDTNTVTVNTALPDGSTWRSDGNVAISSCFAPNTVGEQDIRVGRVGVIQDELSNYTYIQSRLTSGGSGYTGGAVYDENLNAIYVWRDETGFRPYSGGLFCVRIYNSNLYFFSGTSAGGINVTKVALPSLTTTTYTWNDLGGDWGSSGHNRVFNWPINGKFWIYATSASSSPFAAVILTFDIATNTIAQFGPTRTGTSGDYLVTTDAMHVKADGSAVSVATYNATPTGSYGVLAVTASSASFASHSSNGHFSSFGSNYTFGTNSSNYQFAVTPDMVLGMRQVNYGSTFYPVAIPHFQGGETAVQVNEFQEFQYQETITNNPRALPTFTARNRVMIQRPNSENGTYALSRNGTSLVFTKVNSVYVLYHEWGFIPCKQPDEIKVGLSFAHGANSASTQALSDVYILKGTTQHQYSFPTVISSSNSFGTSQLTPCGPTSFVTSTGKLFSLPYQQTNGGASSNINRIQSALPIYTPARGGTYKVTVIGGGGISGTSSSFDGVLAAANGGSRAGFNPGSTVITSGPTRGTGGAGYGEDGWGQGEDTTAAGTQGGGSGYVTIGTMALVAGTSYVYRAGLGPQFGKQGAVLIQEV